MSPVPLLYAAPPLMQIKTVSGNPCPDQHGSYKVQVFLLIAETVKRENEQAGFISATHLG